MEEKDTQDHNDYDDTYVGRIKLCANLHKEACDRFCTAQTISELIIRL